MESPKFEGLILFTQEKNAKKSTIRAVVDMQCPPDSMTILLENYQLSIIVTLYTPEPGFKVHVLSK